MKETDMHTRITSLLFGIIIASNIVTALNGQILLFSGNANKDLAEKIADHLQITLGQAIVSRFNDGEIQIQIKESYLKNTHLI